MGFLRLKQKMALRYYRFAYRYGKRIMKVKNKEVSKKLLKKKPCTIPSIFDEIAERIAKNDPFLLARLGSIEGNVTGEYCERELGIRKHYSKMVLGGFFTNTGFFADDWDDKEKAMDEYARLTLEGLRECDYLSAFFPPRIYMPFFFQYYALNATPTFSDFGPYFGVETDKTWLRALKGKRVLVVNSFTDSIAYQYQRKAELVSSKEFELPDFELLTYKTFVTQVGERIDGFSNSFQILEKMISDIRKIDFDIALIGAGAYGFPIAVEVKRMGKTAIETCGRTPLFFGVYGERNLRQGEDKYMTDAWIRPMEKPPIRFKEIEGGCYW